jgi:hypothetical protein
MDLRLFDLDNEMYFLSVHLDSSCKQLICLFYHLFSSFLSAYLISSFLNFELVVQVK